MAQSCTDMLNYDKNVLIYVCTYNLSIIVFEMHL